MNTGPVLRYTVRTSPYLQGMTPEILDQEIITLLLLVKKKQNNHVIFKAEVCLSQKQHVKIK